MGHLVARGFGALGVPTVEIRYTAYIKIVRINQLYKYSIGLNTFILYPKVERVFENGWGMLYGSVKPKYITELSFLKQMR